MPWVEFWVETRRQGEFLVQRRPSGMMPHVAVIKRYREHPCCAWQDVGAPSRPDISTGRERATSDSAVGDSFVESLRPSDSCHSWTTTLAGLHRAASLVACREVSTASR